MRETTVVLDSENALASGVTAAVADKYRLTKVRISTSLHHMISAIQNHNTVREDPILRNFGNLYDSIQGRTFHTEKCGYFFGVEVFNDGRLTGNTLVIESQPIPAGKLV